MSLARLNAVNAGSSPTRSRFSGSTVRSEELENRFGFYADVVGDLPDKKTGRYCGESAVLRPLEEQPEQKNGSFGHIAERRSIA